MFTLTVSNCQHNDKIFVLINFSPDFYTVFHIFVETPSKYVENYE